MQKGTPNLMIRGASYLNTKRCLFSFTATCRLSHMALCLFHFATIYHLVHMATLHFIRRPPSLMAHILVFIGFILYLASLGWLNKSRNYYHCTFLRSLTGHVGHVVSHRDHFTLFLPVRYSLWQRARRQYL